MKLPGKSKTGANSAMQVFDEMPETGVNSAVQVFDEMPLIIAEPNLAVTCTKTTQVWQQINNMSSSVGRVAGRGQEDDTDQVVAAGASEVFVRMPHPENNTVPQSRHADQVADDLLEQIGAVVEAPEQIVTEVYSAGHVFDKRSHPSVYGDKVFDKRSQSIIPVAEVFVKWPDPTLPKNTAPSSSSASYSNNHRNKVARSQVWKPINSTGASILKADLSTLDQGPALSDSGMMLNVIEEDEHGLDLNPAGQITETFVVADCEANRGTPFSDLARVVGRDVEHCAQVQGSTTLVLQQLDQVALQAPNDLSSGDQITKVQLTKSQDVDAINQNVGTESTSTELRNVAYCVGAEIQLPQVQHQQVAVEFLEQQQVQATSRELEQNLENGSLVQLEQIGSNINSIDEDDGQKDLVVKGFLHHVTALQLKIDQAGNAVIDRIAKSPSTSEFLKKKVVSKAYLEEAKAWRWAHGTKDELCDKSASGKKGRHSNPKHTWADLVDEEELQQVEQKDQPHAQRHWSTTVQVAQIGEATGIVQAALKQLKGADGLRGQRLSFDDNG
ncbi:hypothetical protein LIER_43673 [Lithospermum erythrorhizon]|uniref:Uncharacterized protein n=1 Tax=Lithospermum erythrorhizon TaxID=34254 RepID=A0AAV3QLX2_LITER